MVTNLHFNFKDVFRAGRLGFSAKKMWISFLGLIIGGIGYTILSYIAFLAAGIEISEVWSSYRLMPFLFFDMTFPWYSWVLWIVGILWWLCVTLITGVAVSKVTYEQLKGDEFYEIKEAFKFALKNGKSAILAPFVLIVFIAALIVMGIILALITWIPYFGQLFFALMAIPAFFVCIFILYLVVVTFVSLVIGPSIVGTTGNDTFDTLFESFSVINDQPWRFFTYEFLLKLVMFAGVIILGFFAAKAIYLCYTVINIIVPDEKLGNLFANAAYYVKIVIPDFYPEAIKKFITGYVEWIGMPNLLFPPEYIPAYESWAGAITSFVLGIIYYLIIAGVLSLGCSIYWAGNTLIFTVLVKKKDDKNLLEIKEEVFEEKKEEKPEEKLEEKEEEKKAKKRKKEEEPQEKTEEEKKE
ncbi:MAG: hypothetical protein N3A65_00820 [candidate division WOR-3 bacterium]|nr:hypothetical protein [candidate division WOR-3 bacterium]